MKHDAWIREALGLAQRGRGRVEPNPRVGALAIQDGKIVGRGFHAYYGGPHAEVIALREAREGGARPDTLVVTLEPCSSKPGEEGKKTPPCTEAIMDAGIERVIIGTSDPDPRHSARGEEQLVGHGIQVVTQVLDSECLAINRPFLRWLAMDVPWVIAKWAMSVDGKTATRDGDSRWISCQDSRNRVHELRSQVDAVLVGYRTAARDDPELTVRHVEGPNPIRIVVDPLAALATEQQLVQTAGDTPTWVLVGPEAPHDDVDRLVGRGVEVIRAPAGAGARSIDLGAACRGLRERGIRRLLLEGGGRLTGEFVAAGLVHQVMAFIAPLVLGGREAPTPVHGGGVAAVQDAWQFTEFYAETSGADVLVHGFAT